MWFKKKYISTAAVKREKMPPLKIEGNLIIKQFNGFIVITRKGIVSSESVIIPKNDILEIHITQTEAKDD
jgi:hypothetical protein